MHSLADQPTDNETKRAWRNDAIRSGNPSICKILESACFSADPEGKILIFYGSFGATANFTMVPKFEETPKKSTGELVEWVMLASFAVTQVNQRLMTAEDSALSSAMKCLAITGDPFHPEWNYTIRPRPP